MDSAQHDGPLLIALHWLGGSARTWSAVADELERFGLPTAALDLPGFGNAAALDQYTVAEMRDYVIAAVTSLRGVIDGTPWILAGHSMGGKVALAVARAALDGAPGLANLGGLVLVSPSPPAPEPMKESKREELLQALGHAAPTQPEADAHALKFVSDNTGKPSLPAALESLAVADVLRASPAAFRAWLENGSREDWTDRIGTINLPALVFAGEAESALGPDAQRELTLPHLPQAQLLPLVSAAHLGPLERPGELAAHVAEFAAAHFWIGAEPESPLAPTFQYLLLGEHTSAATRTVLERRLASSTSWYTPQSMGPALFRTHRAFVNTVLPDPLFDLAARIDTELATGLGDGYRPAALPADAAAWALGLQSLDAAAERIHTVSFLALDTARRTELLQRAADGELDARSVAGHLHLGETAGFYNAAQMKLWFEDARGLVTRLYTADPRTYARIGFTGFTDDPQGFTHIKLNSSDERIDEEATR